MPYDASPPAEVTARDRVIMLRDFLATLPDEQFNMDKFMSRCGTVGCIAGWQGFLIGDPAPSGFGLEVVQWSDRVTASLGLDHRQKCDLFYAYGRTRAEAIAVLDRYLETGRIEWEAV